MVDHVKKLAKARFIGFRYASKSCTYILEKYGFDQTVMGLIIAGS